MSIKKKLCFVFLIVLCILVWGASLQAREVIKGDIVAVDSQEETFLLKNEAGIREFKINSQTELIRNEQEIISLAALRPITEHDFQEAALKVDTQGNLKQVKAEYRARPIEIKEIDYNEAVLKLLFLDSQELIKIEYRSDIDLKKNNYSVKLSNLRPGEEGLLILGLEQRVRQLQVTSYEY